MTDRETAAEGVDPGGAAPGDSDPGGFVDFFRRYTRTWVHAVATAGLTAFGTLTVVHRGFAALALAAYVVPPVALYLSRGSGIGEGGTTEPTGDPTADTEESPRSDEGPRETDETTTPGWTSADAPVDADLRDAVVVPAAAYAVGESGVVLADGGDGWTVVFEDGAGARGNALNGVDATGDGAAVWTAGDGGALARIDPETTRHVDFSAPDDITDAWVDVAAAGAAGSETVLLVNGSGEALRGRYRDGEVAWSAPRKPGSGSSFSGVDFADGRTGYLCDTNDGVYRTGDAGETFDRVGVDGPDGTLTGVAALAEDSCLVTSDDGAVDRYDGTRWTPESVADGALLAVDAEDEYVVACGETDVYEREGPTGGWDRSAVPVQGPLRGVGVGDGRAVGVGDDGSIVERRLSPE